MGRDSDSMFKDEHFSLLPSRQVAGYSAASFNFSKVPINRVQYKLEMGYPGDIYEREADIVAEKVMNMHTLGDSHYTSGNVLQQQSKANGKLSQAPSIVSKALSVSGRPLDAITRTFFERRFGQDLSQVQIHTDTKAAESAKMMNALAYTVGQDVVFAAGRYEPESLEGKKLLAHELVHTLQQSGLGVQHAVPSMPDADIVRDNGNIFADSVNPLQAPLHLVSSMSNSGMRIARQPADEPYTVEEKIRVELEKNIAEDDEKAIEQRRQRLRELFESVPTSKAKELYDRLSRGMKGDAFAQFFQIRLATATRQEMFGILKKKFTSAPSLSEAQQDAQIEGEVQKQDEAQKKVQADLANAKKLLSEATSVLEGLASGDLDPDLLDRVRAQGEATQETTELFEEFAAVLAGMPEDLRKTAMGAGAIELQMYLRNVEHLVVLNKIVSLELPDAVSNQEEVEEELDRYANWHESWIDANEGVADLSADLIALTMGLEGQIQMDISVAEQFIKHTERSAEEAKAIETISNEVERLAKEAKAIEDRARLAQAAEFILSLRRGGGPRPKGPRSPPRSKLKPKTPSKTKAKTRKQFKKPKGGSTPKKAKERKKKDKKKKEKRRGAYPICWPIQLGPPMLSGVPVPFFVRTPEAERDTDDAKQRRMQLFYREKVDRHFVAKDWHVHHVVPLFLGGLDATPLNLTLVLARLHLKGHAVLAHQPQMAKPLGGLKPMSVNLYDHPAGTRYRLAGFKKERDEVCRR